MSRNCLGSTHQLRSGAARLVRLAAVACLALAAGSAAVWAQASGEPAGGHRCIHDELQQRVLQSVAQEHRDLGRLSAVGLPVVAAAKDLVSVRGTVDYALPYSTVPTLTRSEHWGELRITVSTDDFTDTERYCTHDGQEVNNHETGVVECKKDDILTEEKRDILINSILPEAVRLHKDRLKVRQVQGNWKVTEGNGKICGLFNVPETHVTNGVNNTDFLLYLTTVPSDAGVVAWGSTCQVFPDGQPGVGVINVPAAVIVSRYDQRVIRMVAHQIAHALGFGDRFFRRAGITKNVTNIRGMPDNFTVINGSTTVKKAREHYNCPTLKHLEMEGLATLDVEISHIKMRNAKDELMAPEVSAGYYSALTMAIFEDTGFYKADFSKAEVLPWGRNAGCEFLDQKCMGDGITQWPQMFCNSSKMVRCTSSRLAIGVCDVHTHESPLDEYYQYFTNTKLGGDLSIMDYCPYVGAKASGACNQNSSTAPDYMSAFNVFSDAARCIDGAFAPKNISTVPGPILGMCASVKCDNKTNTYSIQVKGSRSYVNCAQGKNITLDTISSAFEASGYITCPPYVEVCQGNVKAVMDFEGDREHSASNSNLSGSDIVSSSGSDVRHSSSHLGSSSSGSDNSHPRGNSAAGVRSARTFLTHVAAVAVILIGLFCV